MGISHERCISGISELAATTEKWGTRHGCGATNVNSTEFECSLGFRNGGAGSDDVINHDDLVKSPDPATRYREGRFHCLTALLSPELFQCAGVTSAHEQWRA